jgi:GDP-D-mannose dehydratase
MAVVKVRIGNADTMLRKGFVKAFHAMLHTMLAQKRPGDSVEVTYDDGSVEHHTIGDVRDVGDGLEIDLSPGKQS